MVKIIILIMSIMISALSFSCSVDFKNYIEIAFPNDKNLEVLDSYSRDFTEGIFFKYGNKLYYYGEELKTIDEKTYKYLNSGYYIDGNKIYYLNREKEIYTLKNKDKIKAYTIKKPIINGTSCSGQFSDYEDYLKVDGLLFLDGNKIPNFIGRNFIIKILSFLRIV